MTDVASDSPADQARITSAYKAARGPEADVVPNGTVDPPVHESGSGDTDWVGMAGRIAALTGISMWISGQDATATVVNAMASLGNAIFSHPDEATALLLGLLGILGGGAGIAGSGGACVATVGVGCIPAGAGVAASWTLAAAGVTAVGVAGASLIQHAQTDSSMQVMNREPNSGDNFHNDLNAASREVDVDDVWKNGELYIQYDKGRLVKVLDEGNGYRQVVIREADGKPVSSMRITENSFQERIADGRWQ